MADNDMLHTAEILKAALPFVDTNAKTTMDLLIKFYELITCYHNYKTNRMAACDYTGEKPDLETMLKNIQPKCNEKEKPLIDRILSIFNAKRMYEMYNTYMTAMKAMQEFGGFPSEASEGETADNSMNNFSGFDFSSIFGNSQSTDTPSEESYTPYESAPEPGYESDLIHKSDSGDNPGTSYNPDVGYSSDVGYKPDSDDSSNTGYNSDFNSDSKQTPEGTYGKVNSDRNSSSSKSDNNDNMMNMLKSMIPPDQVSTFENLRMLLNTMSYDNSSKSD